MTPPTGTTDRAARWLTASATSTWVFAALCMGAGMAYMMQTAIRNLSPTDFTHFWGAGRIWLEGGNPYAASYTAIVEGFAAAEPNIRKKGGIHRWLYGPHIWGLTVGFGALDYLTARILWAVVSALTVLGGCYLALAAVLQPRHAAFAPCLGLLCLVASGTVGTAMNLSIGQFASFSFIAAAAFIYGVLRQSPLAITLALIVLTMKPSLAMPFLGFALMVPAMRGPLFAAAAISIAIAIPPVMSTPLPEMIQGYLEGLSIYGSFAPNAPNALTGLTNLFHTLTGISLSGVVFALIGTGAGALVGWHARRRGIGPETMAALLATACFCVPLHLYDMTLVVLFAVLWPWPWSCALAVIVNLAMFRVNRLERITGLNDPESAFTGSFLASLLLIALLTAALWLLLTGRRRPDAGGDP